jgi:hypothetical protein
MVSVREWLQKPDDASSIVVVQKVAKGWRFNLEPC